MVISTWMMRARGLLAVFGAGGLVAAASASGSALPAPTTLIQQALIVDGTGAPAFRGSLRIEGDRIAAVGSLAPRPGELVVDARGLVVAPGFIDAHSHHDIGLPKQPTALAATSQGITTIVVGQDGSSNHPLATFFADLEQSPAALNVASYAGHGTIRAQVMGKDFRRRARPTEIGRMSSMLAADMRAGALGLSTGLEYDPGLYSAEAEVVSLARTAARLGGRYASHVRSEDRRLWESLEEFLRLGRAVRAPAQLSHAKLAMVPLWGQAPRMIEKLESARRQGRAVTADVYPYTYWQSTLTILFPERDFKDRAAAEFALRTLATPDGLRLSLYRPDPTLVGKTLAEIARQRGTDPAQTLMDLIAAAPDSERDEMVIGTSMREDDVEALIRWPHSSICSDGSLDDLHPRGTGAFTRVLGHYVRERKLLTLEDAIRKMTGLTARSLGIRDRGVIRAGAYADLVLLDPALVSDRATIERPDALSVGVERVWVNGRPVLERGRPTGVLPGRVIRRGAA